MTEDNLKVFESHPDSSNHIDAIMKDLDDSSFLQAERERNEEFWERLHKHNRSMMRILTCIFIIQVVIFCILFGAVISSCSRSV